MVTDVEQRREEAGVLWGRLLLMLAILIFAWRAYEYIIPSVYGLADEHGYLTTAKRLATQGTFAQHQADPYAFIGETMMQSPRDSATYYLRQPIGYPLLAAAFYWMGNAAGPFYLNPLMAIVLLCGVYQIGKELRVPLLGAAAALVVALHPLVLYYATSALSHLPDMAAGAWVVVMALLWRREGRGWQAAAVGLLAGAAVMIRYTNILLLLPLGVVAFEQWRDAARRKRWGGHLLLGAAGFILMLIPLMMYQWTAFGGPLRTGYSAGGNETSFSWGWLVAHTPAMARILWMPGTGLGVLLIGVAAGVIVLARRDRFSLALLLAWALPPLLLYTAYYGMPARNTLLYARFTLSSLAPLVLLGVLWAKYLRLRRSWTAGLVAVLVGATIGMNAASALMRKSLAEHENFLLFHYSMTEMVQSEAPAGSVIIADEFTYYGIDYAGDYVLYNPDLFSVDGVAWRTADLRRTPHEFDPARTRQIEQLLGGKSDVELRALLQERVRHYLAAGTPVYIVALTEHAPAWSQILQMPLKQVAVNVLDTGLYEVTSPG